MIRRQPRATRPATLFPYTSLVRSRPRRRSPRFEGLLQVEADDGLGCGDDDAGAHQRGPFFTGIGLLALGEQPVEEVVLGLLEAGYRLDELGAVPLHRVGVALGVMVLRSDEHTSALPSLMSTSYAVFCLKKKKR